MPLWGERVKTFERLRKPGLKRIRREERKGSWKWWLRAAAVIVILVLAHRMHLL
jgi:CRISPR type III-B/RAMP module RAMP protein Cmr1